MQAFEIQTQSGDSRSLTQAVLQIIQQLDMFNAELARVLQCQCSDIGRLASAQHLLQQDSPQWRRAEQFVDFYQLLYRYKQGDGVAMRHWCRAQNDELGNSPHLLIVDEHKLDNIIDYLRRSLSR